MMAASAPCSSPSAAERRLSLPTGRLRGRHVILEPLATDIRSELRKALASDEEAWSVMVYNGGRSAFDEWWRSALVGIERRERIGFAIRRASDNAIVGSTGYFGISHEHRRVEIGSTFIAPDARSGPINPETKLLLLDGAFLGGAIRVEFVTDVINERSRAALRKLGAIEEGVLRRHKTTWTGRVRDTVIYSIIAEDWPAVRQRLVDRVRRDD